MDWQKVESIFLQGDGRYELGFAETLVEFFNKSALILEKEELEDFNFKSEELESINGPQKLAKAVGKKLLIINGFALSGYEKDLGWGIADVVGEDRDGNLIVIECGPCRLTKVVDYFRNEWVKELWVVSYYSDERFLYRIKKGFNWESIFQEFENTKIKNLLKIKSPLDS